MNDTSRPRPAGAVPLWPLPLFVVSGFAGLVLESVLLRQLAWIFGNSARATSLVLAAFMGGLALGAAWWGKRADATRWPLRLFGWLELGAAGTGAGLVWLLGSGREWFLAPLRAIGPGPLEQTVEFVVAFGLVLVPTVLMGGTLPALARAVIRDADRFAGRVGLLYGLNTLGAAAGVFTAGFVLFERLGVSQAAYLAAALQALVGVTAIAFGGRAVAPAMGGEPRGARAAGHDEESAAPHGPLTPRGACLTAAAVCGFAVLGYEVIWTRLLSLFMRSFSYSFSLMLGLFLMGLFLGALLTPWVGRFVAGPTRALGVLLVAMGSWVAASILWLPSLLSPVPASSFEGFLGGAALPAAPVVLPPTVLSGMALPFAVAGFSRGVSRIGRDVGVVYAANTVGAILGALVAGLLLLPVLGAPVALVLLATLNTAAGALTLGLGGAGRRSVVLATVVTAVCLVPVLGAEARFVDGFLRATQNRATMGETLFFHEGASDTIAIVRRNYGFRDPEAKSLITNGVAMSATVKPVWRYMAAEGHLPLLFAREPRTALAVGVGTGITLGAIASHPRLTSITAVELSEGVIRGLDRFATENGGAHRAPGVSLLREDGRHFLELTDRRFDVITLEPPPPIVAGSVHLYSRDFYDLCLERLEEGGAVAQWLPLHAQSLASARMVARSFLDAFPYVSLWLPSVRDAVLIGAREPLSVDGGRLRELWAEPATAENLRAAYLETPEALLGTFLLDRAGIETWVGDAPAITDERPRMEFFRNQGGNMVDVDILTLLEVPQAGRGWLEGTPAEFERRVALENRALRLYARSLIEQDGAAQVNAARIGLGTEFFLYPMGCTAAQLANLDVDPEIDAARAEAHRGQCSRLRGIRNTLDAP